MAYVNLREYIEVLEAGKRPKGGAVNEGVPSLGGEHITNTGKFNLSNDKLKYVPREYYDELKKGKIKINDVLVVKDGATTGKTAIVEDDFLLKEACINEHVFLLRTKDSLNPKYLFYYFLSEQGQQEILKDFRGATVGGISKDFIDMDIYISDLDTQKKIVEVLDKAQELIDKRKEQIEVLDALVKSRFIEMFGDPIGNTKGWKTEKMNSVAPTVNYKGNFNEEKVWLLNLDMVESNTGNIIEYNYVNIEELGNSTCTFDTTNVLYSKLRPYLNKVVIPNEKGYATSEMIPLQPIKGILNRQYLTYMLRNKSFVDYISEKVSGAKMPRVIMNDFRNFDVPIPPIELQNQFVDFVNQIDKLKSEMETSLKELEDNFNSLMQKAFKGELF